MTTVVDPLGTPVPIFNRSGTAIVRLTGAGTSSTSGPVIPAICGRVVALIDCTAGNYASQLSPNAEIGDIAEVYVDRVSTMGGEVFAPSGETINSQSTPSSIGISAGGGVVFRKVSATEWMSR